ncbi:MAG: PspC domain-containing protein [Sphingomonas sp.]|nr:PspC domain-containing protein [Sphingomonas sp.]
MQTEDGNLFTRDDTLLGVCEGLGEDLGFNPNWLRAALGAGLIWNPLAMIGIYLGLGVIVLFTRLVMPNPRRAAVSEAAQPDETQTPAEIAAEPLPIAA